MKEMNYHYSDEELVNRIWDKEEIKDLISRHAYYQSSDLRELELDTLWVQSRENQRTATLGSNWGFYVGMPEIKRYYVQNHRKHRQDQLKPYIAAGVLTECGDENLGFGCWDMHTISSPLLQLAGDGKTARGLWYDCGQLTVGSPDGTADENFIFGLVAVDFIKENGKWKIWHMILENDHTVPVGELYSNIPVYRDQGSDPAEVEFGIPTIHELVHDSTYGWADHFPDIPEPYDTYTDENSYSQLGKRAKYYTISREYDIPSVMARDKRWE